MIKQGSTQIAERLASAHAPAVAITAPGNGAQWSGVETVSWTASDADGDPLTYTVLYSSDGTEWQALETDLTTMSYQLDTGQIAGGTQARLMVMASDGFHTSSAEVGPFSVARHSPRIVIIQPESGTRILQGQPLSLRGNGDDLEDGLLPEDALSWSSNINGDLGTGPTIMTEKLSTGDHVITLTGRDSEGNAASDSISLQIRQNRLFLPIITSAALPVVPTPTPASCDLLFSDNFSAAGLGGWTANGGEWTNPGGYMHVRSGPATSAWNVKDASTLNFSYEGTITVRSGNGAGLSFRTINGTTGYDVMIDIVGGQIGLIERPSARWLGSSAFDAQRDVPYRLRVDARGGLFDVYLDGVKRFTVADASYGAGKFGIFAYNSGADIDDVRACRLSVPYEMRVNAGGSGYTDTQHLIWFEDQAYNVGIWGYEGSSLVWSGSDPVAGTEDDTLYHSARWAFADFKYKFDVPNGSYRIRLLFSEPYFTEAGKRTFDVKVEGQTVLANLDLFAVAGHDAAYVRAFNVTVSDGQLEIGFIRKVDTPIIHGIEVVGSAAASPTVTRTQAAPGTATRTATSTMTATATRTGTRAATAPPDATATRTATATATPPRATGTATRTFTPSPTATRTRTATMPPSATVVALANGNVLGRCDQPAARAYANTQAYTPPAGVSVSDSGGLWRNGEWVALMMAGQWIEATNSNASSVVGVQLWGDTNDGWARVRVDGVQVWQGSVYGAEPDGFIKYLQISGLAPGAHSIRVESMGINGAGGGDDVSLYFFGFGSEPLLPPGLHGRLTHNGAPAAAVDVGLYYYNGSAWEISAATARSSSNGCYSFSGLAGLSAGRAYTVAYENDIDPSRLSYWWGPAVETYTAGTRQAGGSFDLANVSLVSPPGGNVSAFPITFIWQPRGIAGDTYRWSMVDPETWDWWQTGDLGSADRVTLTVLPSGAQYGRQYCWQPQVLNGSNGYGQAYYCRYVTFLQSGAPPAEPFAKSDSIAPPLWPNMRSWSD